MRARQLLKVGDTEVEKAEHTPSHLHNIPHNLYFTISAKRDLHSCRVTIVRF